jgi:hypothetical protein
MVVAVNCKQARNENLHTKLEKLKYIRDNEPIQSWQFRDYFDYAEGAFRTELWRLKKQGLIINMPVGFWVLTETGYRRLEYHDEKQTNKH